MLAFVTWFCQKGSYTEVLRFVNTSPFYPSQSPYGLMQYESDRFKN